jgi:hypothetical protein
VRPWDCFTTVLRAAPNGVSVSAASSSSPPRGAKRRHPRAPSGDVAEHERFKDEVEFAHHVPSRSSSADADEIGYAGMENGSLGHGIGLETPGEGQGVEAWVGLASLVRKVSSSLAPMVGVAAVGGRALVLRIEPRVARASRPYRASIADAFALKQALQFRLQRPELMAKARDHCGQKSAWTKLGEVERVASSQ